MKKAYFTKHSFNRCYDRLTLWPDDVALILNNDEAIPIAKESSSTKFHRLFYSILDDDFFIAIQDEKNGEVVTILPLNYYRNRSVSAEAISDAKSMAVKREYNYSRRAMKSMESLMLPKRYKQHIEAKAKAKMRAAVQSKAFSKIGTKMKKSKTGDRWLDYNWKEGQRVRFGERRIIADKILALFPSCPSKTAIKIAYHIQINGASNKNEQSTSFQTDDDTLRHIVRAYALHHNLKPEDLLKQWGKNRLSKFSKENR